jgi:hypothetical protein
LPFAHKTTTTRYGIVGAAADEGHRPRHWLETKATILAMIRTGRGYMLNSPVLTSARLSLSEHCSDTVLTFSIREKRSQAAYTLHKDHSLRKL